MNPSYLNQSVFVPLLVWTPTDAEKRRHIGGGKKVAPEPARDILAH
jgi:hypothetical protein